MRGTDAAVTGAGLAIVLLAVVGAAFFDSTHARNTEKAKFTVCIQADKTWEDGDCK